MKTVSFIFVFLLGFAFASFAQDAKPKKEDFAKIKTSAQCGMCKDRIEKAMSYEKGIKKAILNLDTKELEVTFQTKKTNVEAIRTALTKVGYDADGQPSDAKAYEKLPACCKKGGHN